MSGEDKPSVFAENNNTNLSSPVKTAVSELASTILDNCILILCKPNLRLITFKILIELIFALTVGNSSGNLNEFLAESQFNNFIKAYNLSRENVYTLFTDSKIPQIALLDMLDSECKILIEKSI